MAFNITSKNIWLLDGGMGQELLKRGIENDPKTWSAHALLTAPDTVREVHEAFIRAGADIITTNTYATQRPRLEVAGIADQFEKLNLLACKLAHQARENTGHLDVAVAGALPPLGGSYRPDNVRDYDEMVMLYREMCAVMAPHVDLFLAETLSMAIEGKAVAVAARAFDLPVVISWTLADGTATLRGNESLTEAFAMLEGLPVAAVLTNCSTPESITAAMQAASAANMPLVGGYANGFTEIPGDWDYQKGVQHLEHRDLTPDEYTEHVAAWIANGAKIVGGCCEGGPAHIAALRAHIDRDST